MQTEFAPRSETKTTLAELDVKFAETLEALKVLPAGEHIDEIYDVASKNRAFLADMEPGAGKSYVLPPAMWSFVRKNNPDPEKRPKVLVIESRRNLVKELGDHGPKEQGKPQKPEEMTLKDRLGDDVVGYSNKFNKADPGVAIDFVVEKTFENRIFANPGLQGVDVVIVDEAHREMGLVMRRLEKAMKLNPNLIVVFATGTADAARGKLHKMFPDMGEVKIEGRKHVVNKEWGRTVSPKDAPGAAAELTTRIIERQEKEGNILTFLSGGKELDEYIANIQNSTSIPQDDIEIIRVMGKDKDTIARIKANTGKRKIIASTNALEEGVNPNCDIVIVSGWRKIKTVDPVTGIEQIKSVRISRNSVEQQEKRGGRNREGTAYHLFQESDFNNPDIFPVEDLEVRDLTADILTLIAAGEKDELAAGFEKEIDPRHIEAALQRLKKLGALDKDHNLTEIGRYMREAETEPQYARMLYEAEKRGCDDGVAILIGIMGSDRQLFGRNATSAKLTHPESDFLSMLEVWNRFVKINYGPEIQKKEMFTQMESEGINVSVLKEAATIRRDLVKIRGNLYPEIKLTGEGNKAREIQVSILAGLADRLLLRDENGTYHLENKKAAGIRINPNSGLSMEPHNSLVSGKIIHRPAKGGGIDLAELNQAVNMEELYELFPYLKEFKTVEKPPSEEIKEVVPPPPQETAIQKDDAKDIIQQMHTLDSQIVVNKTPAAQQDANKFIQKIKENWHNLSERVKILVKAFTDRLKKLVGIKTRQ